MPVYYVGPGSTGENVPITRSAMENMLENAPVNLDYVNDQLDSMITGAGTNLNANQGNTPTTGTTNRYATQTYVTDYISGWSIGETGENDTWPPLPAPNTLAPGSSYVFNDYIQKSAQGASTGEVGSTGWTGVAQLDSSGHVPLAQLPLRGVGYIGGPIPANILVLGQQAVKAVPVPIASWHLGAVEFDFIPLVFMDVMAHCQEQTNPTTGQLTNGLAQPVIYVTMSNSTTAPSLYAPSASQVQIAMGTGRKYFNGQTPVAVLPAPPANMPSSAPAQPTAALYQTAYPAGYNLYITAWMADLTVNGVGMTVSASDILKASLYLMRTQT